MTRRLLPIVLVALAAASCGSNGREDPLPSGSLGIVTPTAAEQAVLGLCDLRGATVLVEASAIFLDRAHATLHEIAAAADVKDRPASSTLLEAKQRVEADLEEPTIPGDFDEDLESLLDATRGALEAIGLEAPACPA